MLFAYWEIFHAFLYSADILSGINTVRVSISLHGIPDAFYTHRTLTQLQRNLNENFIFTGIGSKQE